MKEEGLNQLIECLRTITNLQVESETLYFFLNKERIDFTELSCQLFDDTGLQDIIDSQSVSEHFSPASCVALSIFGDKFQLFVACLSKREMVKESLETLRTSAFAIIDSFQ